MSESEKDREDEDKNPAVAVALAHDPDSGHAPRVVAGGRGHIAEQIMEIAFANGVRVRQDADLAQLLTSIDLDSEIPVEAFAAVAEILTYVYQANADYPGADAPRDGGLSALWTKEP